MNASISKFTVPVPSILTGANLHRSSRPVPYYCPSPSALRNTSTLLDPSTLSPLTSISTLSPKFNVSLAYSLVACNSFRVVISRADRRTCAPLGVDELQPSYDAETWEYIKTVLGPDAFQVRVDGAERLVMDTPSKYDQTTCSWTFDFTLNAAGTVWLGIIHQYEVRSLLTR